MHPYEWILYTVLYTLYNVQCTMYSVQCTVYTMYVQLIVFPLQYIIAVLTIININSRVVICILTLDNIFYYNACTMYNIYNVYCIGCTCIQYIFVHVIRIIVHSIVIYTPDIPYTSINYNVHIYLYTKYTLLNIFLIKCY